MNTNTTFVGELRKGHISYYFEISEGSEFMPEENVNMPVESAYIEKTYADTDRGEFGHFSVEQARKCWKALKLKGYREFDSLEGKYLEPATK